MDKAKISAFARKKVKHGELIMILTFYQFTETYALLIKVAESVADQLVANIIMEVIEEATQYLVNQGEIRQLNVDIIKQDEHLERMATVQVEMRGFAGKALEDCLMIC